MGTRKKLVLASLVSLMMVLALGIGWLPSQTAAPVGAADSGRVDASELLGEVLNFAKVDNENVQAKSDLDNLLILTPDGGDTDLAVPMEAAVGGAAEGDTVHYVTEYIGLDPDTGAPIAAATGFDVADPLEDSLPLWQGPLSQITGPFGGLDFDEPAEAGAAPPSLTPFLEAGMSSTLGAFRIYALVNAVQQKQTAAFEYEAGSRPGNLINGQLVLPGRPIPGNPEENLEAALGKGETVEVLVELVDAARDADGNALPDDGDVPAGAMWHSIANNRAVYLANLDDSSLGSKQDGSLTIQAGPEISVEVPTQAQLAAEGLIGNDASALVLVSVVDDFEAAVDEVGGDSSATALEDWADDVADAAPGEADARLGALIEVSILTANPGETYTEIDDLSDTTLSVGLTISSADLTGAVQPLLWSYPTNVADDGANILLTADEAIGSWNLVAPGSTTVDAGAGTLSATMTELSLIATYDSGVLLDEATPARVPQDFAADIELTGTLPLDASGVETTLTVVEANDRFEVEIDGAAADFRDGTGSDVAVETDGTGATTLYVTTPEMAATGAKSVTITANPGEATENTRTFDDLLSVETLYTIDREVRDSLSGDEADGSGEIVFSPTQSPDLPENYPDPVGAFYATDLNGDDQEVQAIYDGSLGPLQDWELASGAAIDADGNFTVSADDTVTAEYLPGFVLSTDVSPADGGAVLLSPDPDGTTMGGEAVYEEDTVVTLTAEPADGYEFQEWVGDVADPNAATTTVTMDADKAATANFRLEGTTGLALDVTVTPADAGTVTPDPPGPTYAENADVELTATANEGYVFVEWQGDLTGTDNPATLNMGVADKNVTAVFEEAFTLTTEVDPSDAGTIARDPDQTAYEDGTVVTLEASPNSGFQFDSWSANVTVPDDDEPTVAQVTMTADTTVTASFTEVPEGTPVFNDDAATPFQNANGEVVGEAWLFGGIVLEIQGAGFADGDSLRFTRLDEGGTVVDPTDYVEQLAFADDRDNDGTNETYIVIPPVKGLGWFEDDTDGRVETEVTAIDGDDGTESAPAADPFTFKQYDVVTENGIDVNTTAFLLNAPDESNTVQLFDGADLNDMALELPALDTEANVSQVFGIARNVITDNSKTNTEAIGTAALNNANVLPEDEQERLGDEIEDGEFDFSMHLWQRVEDGKQTTPDAGMAAFPAQANQLAAFDENLDNADVETLADVSSALLTFPTVGSGLTQDDVDDGLRIFGVQLEYDYASNELQPLAVQDVAYQSELYDTEVETDADGGDVEALLEARLYSLNGFTLRRNALLLEDVTDSMRVVGDTVRLQGTDGGDAIELLSELGGLGRVDSVQFVPQGTTGNDVFIENPDLGGATVDDPTQGGAATPPTEYELALNAPAVSEAGVYDVVLYLRSNPDVAISPNNLKGAVEYRAAGPGLGLLLIPLLIGLGIGILGLIEGAEAGGGGGGGPCFIATAAYGTPLASEVGVLRHLRDSVLLESAVGSALVDAYYTVSPAAADVVAQSPMLAAVIRVLLVPIVVTSRVVLAMPMLSAALAMLLSAGWLLRRRARHARQ
ncbi:MAG: InlB B-repeat-containing protein [Candidatus Hydrogenedentota bacterium]